MSLDSVSNRGERLMLLLVIAFVLGLFGFLVRGAWRLVGWLLGGTAAPRRRKAKGRPVGRAVPPVRALTDCSILTEGFNASELQLSRLYPVSDGGLRRRVDGGHAAARQ